MEKIKKIAPVILGVIIVIFTTFLVADRLQLISGFPKGVDAYAHLTRVAWMLNHFPQVNWNPYWDSGTYFWIWTYPPGGSVVTALLIKVTGFSIEQAMTYVSFASFLMFTLSLFALVVAWSRSWLALPVTLLAITTPALWSWWGHGGNYIRLWGIGFYGLSIAMLVYYLRNPRKLTYVIMVIALGFTMSTHMIFGGLIILTVGSYILFAVSGWINKLITFLKTVGVGFLLSSYFYVPIFFSTSGNRFVEGAFGSPIPWRGFLSIDPQYPYFTLPLIFTITAGLAFCLSIFLLFRKKQVVGRISGGAVAAFTLGTSGTLIYLLMGHLPGYPEKGYLAVFPPFATLPILILFTSYLMAGVCGVFFEKFRDSLWLKITSLAASGLILGIFLINNFSAWTVYDVSRPNQMQAVAQTLVKKLNHDPQYRFGTDSAFVADWFNYLYPELPQTRDYIYQGVPYKTWQYLQEYVIWTQDDRYPETEWLLDWYGVKYFTVGFSSAETKYDKFLSKPELFGQEGVNEDKSLYVFEYKKAKPIMSVTNATSVLVIGSPVDYEIVVRNFSLAGWGTDRAIPVYGGKNLSKLSEQDLNQFSTILLYRYLPAKSSSENKFLQKYLEMGGRVVVEAPLKNEETELADWLPVSSSTFQPVRDNWAFSGQSGMLKDVAEGDFGPPRYGNDPWKVRVGQLQGDVQVWLKVSGQPVVVFRKVGNGDVVWSGLNLPYHAESFRNEAEVNVLGKLLKISPTSKLAQVSLIKNQPQERTWVIDEKMKGLVWKESYFPRWNIVWKDSRGKEQKVKNFMAGPGLMYVPLPQDASYPLTMTVRYHLVWTDYLGWGMTIVTLLLVPIYFLGGKILSKNNLIVNKLGSWWEKE